MRNIKTRVFILCFILPMLFVGTIYASSLSSAEKEEIYRAAVLELEAYLESGGTVGSLYGIASQFDRLRGYEQSGCLRDYTLALQKMADEVYDWELALMLEMLDIDTDFQKYIEDKRQNAGSPIGTVAQLKAYAEGREAENRGKSEEAIERYRECIGFFDARARYEELRKKQSAEAYEEAMQLLESANFAGAWFALGRLGGYEDSGKRMAAIESILGYTPADENDNPQPVTGLKMAAVSETEITLTWNRAAHATGYEVAWRESGKAGWTADQTVTGTSATVTGLRMDTAYDFQVTAVSGKVRTQGAELTEVRTAEPTPTPLVLQKVTDLRVTRAGTMEMTLSWNASVNAKTYEVSYRTYGSGSWKVYQTVSGTSVTVTGLSANTSYDFRVIAINGGTRSPEAVLSGQKTAALTPTPAPRYEKGSTIFFGHYPQSASGNDSTPIEWIVLEVDKANRKALVISLYGLDAKPYNEKYIDTTWEKCTLRTWLNGEFYNRAFSASEQRSILTTTVDNGKGQGYDRWNTDGGKSTQDKIFLLSYAEANKYFDAKYGNSSMVSRAAPTAYAISRGAYTNNSNKTAEGASAGWWWLRSPGYTQNDAAHVNSGGSLYSRDVNDDSGCVRPALWIDLASDIF